VGASEAGGAGVGEGVGDAANGLSKGSTAGQASDDTEVLDSRVSSSRSSKEAEGSSSAQDDGAEALDAAQVVSSRDSKAGLHDTMPGMDTISEGAGNRGAIDAMETPGAYREVCGLFFLKRVWLEGHFSALGTLFWLAIA
jgi:hypothetical protein